MDQSFSVSRRQFVAGASGLLLAGAVQQAAGEAVANQETKLALQGGEPAVKGVGRCGTALGANRNASSSRRCSSRTRCSTGRDRRPHC